MAGPVRNAIGNSGRGGGTTHLHNAGQVDRDAETDRLAQCRCRRFPAVVDKQVSTSSCAGDQTEDMEAGAVD